MADQEQLEILKQGVEVWNKWREENLYAMVDFRKAFISGANLSGTDLREADLRGVNLTGSDLKYADLSRADLSEANLTGADLTRVDLRSADLVEVGFSDAKLSETKFSSSQLGNSILANLDLAEAIGLEEVSHDVPSTIGTDTLVRSRGKIPEVFLRGCGLSDWEIESAKLYNPDLSNDERNKILYRIYDLQASQAVQISPLFISYSHADGDFVDKIGDSLTEKGIRFWRDVHDMKAGRIEKQIDRAIRHNPNVLLILSEKSIKSDWVEHEVRTARELEKEMERDVLCPVALDDRWKDSRWPKWLMEQVTNYHVLDFSKWEDDSQFEGMFRRLIDGLELFYKG